MSQEARNASPERISLEKLRVLTAQNIEKVGQVAQSPVRNATAGTPLDNRLTPLGLQGSQESPNVPGGSPQGKISVNNLMDYTQARPPKNELGVDVIKRNIAPQINAVHLELFPERPTPKEIIVEGDSANGYTVTIDGLQLPQKLKSDSETEVRKLMTLYKGLLGGTKNALNTSTTKAPEASEASTARDLAVLSDSIMNLSRFDPEFTNKANELYAKGIELAKNISQTFGKIPPDIADKLNMLQSTLLNTYKKVVEKFVERYSTESVKIIPLQTRSIPSIFGIELRGIQGKSETIRGASYMQPFPDLVGAQARLNTFK